MKRFAALAIVATAAAVVAGFALAGGAGGPTSVSISVSPGGSSCTYRETATPKVSSRRSPSGKRCSEKTLKSAT